jgi:hypothetical protein
VAPAPVEYNDMGIRVDWKPQTALLSPDGDPLPEGARGWDKYGRPSFGDPDDLSLWGDIKAGLNHWWWTLTKPVDTSPEKRKVTAFSKEFWESTEKMVAEAPEGGGGFRAEGMKAVPEVGKALFGETILGITQILDRAKNVDVGNDNANTFLSGIGRTATSVLTLFGEGLNIAAYQLKRGLTARYLSNEMLSEKSTLPDFPVYDEWAGYFMNNVIKYSYEYIRGIESMHRWTPEERADIKQRAIDASRIGYSGIVVPGLGLDYEKRMRAGEDPRILAMEMQNPGVEGIGETLLDPLNPLGWVAKTARAASVRKLSGSKWATIADPDLAKLMDVAHIDDATRAAEHMDDVVRQTGIMYDNTRAGMVTDAATRGATSPTAVSKVHIASRETEDFLQVVSSHHLGEPQKFLDTLNGFVDAASPDPVVRQAGLDALARSNMTPNMLFSEPGNRTAIYLRDLMTDADGVFSPKTTLIDDIAKADGVEELAEVMSDRLSRTYAARNPSIQEQVAQQKQFLELSKTDTAKAARYLDLHPLADTKLSRGIVAVADTHAGLQKWLFRPAYGVMGALYMVASPAYWMRNRISNAVHVAVTVGPRAGFQAMFWGEGDSLAQIKKMTGGSVPTGAGFGFSPGGADTPKFANKGFLALSAANEQSSARIVVHRVLERELGRVMKEGMAIANPRDFGLADDLSAALVQHTKDAWGNTGEAIQTLLDSRGGNGRHLGFLTADQQKLAREYRMYEQIQDAIHSGNLDEALDLLDEAEDAWHELGDMASKEATALDLEGASEIEKTATLDEIEAVTKNLGEAEGDLVTRQKHVGRVYRNKARDAIDELEKLAVSQHQTKVAQTFIEATNEFRAGNLDKARDILSYTIEGKTENLIIDWNEFADIASRGDPKEMLEVAGNIAYNDVKFMSQPHMDAVDEMWDLYYKEADAFNDQTWSISRRASKRSITPDELKALWKEANFGVDPPDVLHRAHLKNKIWKRYRPTQSKRFFSVREKADVLHNLQAEFVGNLGEIPTDTQLMRNADVALETSRLLDEATLAKDGTAYVERVLTFDTKRFSRALEKASDRFDVKVIDGLIEGAEGEGLTRIRWGAADPKTGRIPFEISSTLLDQPSDKIKEAVVRELGQVVLDEIDEAQDILRTVFDDDVDKFSDALVDYVKTGGLDPAVPEDIFQVVKRNEAIAEEQGFRAVYNAPMKGETGISGWGMDTYGEALTRAGGDESRVRVAYVTGDQYKAGRDAAITADTARGQGVVEEAYQYTKFDEGVEWQEVSRAAEAVPMSLEEPVAVLIQDVMEGESQAFRREAGKEVGSRPGRGSAIHEGDLLQEHYTTNRPWVLEARRKGYSDDEIIYVLKKLEAGEDIPDVVSVSGKGVAKTIVGDGIKVEGATNRSKALKNLLTREFDALGGSLTDEVDDIARNGRDPVFNANNQMVAEEVPATHVPRMEAEVTEAVSHETRVIGNALNDPDNVRVKNLLDDVDSIEPVKKQVPIVAPADDAMASGARMAHESRTGVSRYIEEIKQSFKDNWGTMDPPVVDAATRKQMREWAKATDPQVTEARLVATDIANHERDFALHDYGNRIGADLAGGMVYPYHFWYSRTYARWAQRTVTHPGLMAAYFRYRRYMEKKHAGLPDWWKYQINTNELLGIDMENPLFFNLEATLNPLQGMTGVDFNDPRKRVDWTSRTLDDLGKFGPTVWTPYALALAVAYQIQGKEEAASRWAGRTFTGTRLIRDITALLGAKGGRGIEIDPLIHAFSGGIGPYERARIGRQLGEIQVENPELDEALIDAGYNQEGPLWEEAQRRAVNDRAWGNTFGWIFGQGFKPRSETDIQIDRMYSDMYSLIKQKPNYTPEEYRELWDQLRVTHPFMDTILLSRKGGVERDEALAWNVFRRMPPGMSDELTEAAGLPRDTLNTFYDNKGGLSEMSETERMHFMASVIDLSLVLEIPPDATVYEWSAARNSYSQMMEFAEGIWGDNIWDRVDSYYGARDEDNRDEADAILKEDPDIEKALDWKALQMVFDPNMAPYYGGLAKIESYYKGLMYDEIERELGEDIFKKWAEYWRRKDMAEDADAYWDENPGLEEYGKIKDRWEPMIAQHIIEFGADLPDPIGPGVREDFEPFVPVQERIAEMVGTLGQPGYQGWTRQDWVGELGDPVVNLIDDYTRGDSLPKAVKTALERAAERLEMPGGYLTIIGLVQFSGAEQIQPIGVQ